MASPMCISAAVGPTNQLLRRGTGRYGINPPLNYTRSRRNICQTHESRLYALTAKYLPLPEATRML